MFLNERSRYPFCRRIGVIGLFFSIYVCLLMQRRVLGASETGCCGFEENFISTFLISGRL